jgi:hypothetical protein
VSKALLALVVCVALALAGCGGSDDSASTSSSTTQEATTANAPNPSREGTANKEEGNSKQAGDHSSSKGGSKPKGSGAKEGDKDNGNGSRKPPKPVASPPISSRPKAGSRHPAPGVKTVKGGDNSVQEYGVESDEAERREASIALATYLSARAEGNWSGACALLAQRPTEQLERLSGGKADCTEVMKATAKESPTMPGSSITEVLSFRGEGEISGNPSYLIFTGPPGNTLFSMPMYQQGGAWKVGLAQPSELPV